MFGLLKNSKIVQNYAEYYDAFPFTIGPDGSGENDYIKIKSMISPVEFVFVDGRSLITTKNANLLPFIGSTVNPISGLTGNPISRQSICHIQGFDRFTEATANIKNIGLRLSEWIYSVISSMPNLRVLMIDFNEKGDSTSVRDAELSLDVVENYGRSEIKNAPSRLYANIGRLTINLLKSSLKGQYRGLKISNPVKIVMHFGSSKYTPILTTLFRDIKSELQMTISNSYYITPGDMKENEWISRYSFAYDSVGFFADLLNGEGISKWNNFLIYTPDVNCLPQLIRSCLERTSIELMVAIVIKNDGETIVSDVKKSQNLLLNVMSRHFKMKGSGGDYLSDIYYLEILQEFYEDLDSMLEDFNEVRKDKPILSIDWKTLTQTEDPSKQESVLTIIRERLKGEVDIKDQFVLTLFMSDMEVIMDSPIQFNQDPNCERRDWYNSTVASARIWMLYNLTLSNYNASKPGSGLKSNAMFLVIPAILICIMPNIRRMWDREISGLNDIVEYVKTSQNVDAQAARHFMTVEGVYELIVSHKEAIESSYKNTSFDAEDYEDYEISQDCNHYENLAGFLQAFADNWSGLFARGKIIHSQTITSYGPITSEPVAPFLYQMGCRRLEYLERQGLISNSDRHGYITFGISSQWFGQDVRLLFNHKMNYHVLRKYPSAWRFWGEGSPAIPTPYFKSISMELNTKNARNASGFLVELTEESSYKRRVHPAYNWVALPPNTSKLLTTWLAEGGTKAPLSGIRWRIIKSLVSERIEHIDTDPKDHVPHGIAFYTDKTNKRNVIGLSGWLITAPKWGDFSKHFNVILPAIANMIFCSRNTWDNSNFMNPKDQTHYPYPHIPDKDLNLILEELPIFASSEKYSIHSLSDLLHCLSAKMATWMSNESNSVMGLLGLCKEFIYTAQLYDIRIKNVKAAEADQMDALVDSIKSPFPLSSTSMTALVNEAGLLDIKELIGIIVEMRDVVSMTKSSESKKIIEFIIRLFEYIDEMIRLKHIKRNEAYAVCVDFSFDLHQPHYSDSVTKGEDLLIHRLYELPAYHPESKFQSQSEDVDGPIPSLKPFLVAPIGSTPPKKYVIDKDPVDGKTYLSLAWDYGAFYASEDSKNPSENLLVWKGSKIQALEFRAALWWISVPELRAKIHARSLGTEWTMSRWAMWLIKYQQTKDASYFPPIDPILNSITTRKIILIPNSIQKKIAGDLASKEFGIHCTEHIKKLKRVWVENINSSFHQVNVAECAIENERLFVSELAIKDKDELPLRPSESRKAKTETVLETMDRMQEPLWARQRNISSHSWLVVDNYTDISGGSNSTFGMSANTVYVYLPRLYEANISHLNASEKQRIKERLDTMPEYSPGMNVEYIKTTPSFDQGSVKKSEGREGVFESVTISLKEVMGTVKVPRRFRPIVSYIRSHLPIRYGINYKFNVYGSIQYTPIKVTKTKTSQRVKVTWKEYLEDAEFGPSSDYYYWISVEYSNEKYDRDDIMFQGIYGNTCQRSSIYSLFHYVNERIKETKEQIFSAGETISVIHEAVQLFQARIGWSIQSNNNFGKSHPFVDMLGLARERAIELVSADESIEPGPVDCDIAYHGYGFYSEDHWILRFREQMAVWFHASQVPKQMVVSQYDSAVVMSVHMANKYRAINTMWDVARFAAGNSSDLPFLFQVYYSLPLVTRKLEEKELANIFESDFCQFCYQLAKVFGSYRTGSKIDTDSFMFLSRAIKKNEKFSYQLQIEKYTPFAIRSSEYAELVFEKIFCPPKSIKFSDVKFDWHKIGMFLEELESSTSFVFVRTEEDVNKILQYTLPILKERYDMGDRAYSELSAVERYFSEDVKSLLPEDLSYMNVDPEDELLEVSFKMLIRTSHRPQLMRSVVNKIVNGNLVFRTTERDYGSLGIESASAFADSSMLWEEISEVLPDKQRDFFDDASITDSELDALEEDINVRAKGAILKAKKKSREKIIRELAEGREVMMFFLSNEELDPRSSEEFARLVYNIFDSRDNGGLKKHKQIRKGANDFDSELSLRKSVNKTLSDYNLALVFTGEYDRESEGSLVPKKETRKKYAAGLTIYIKNEKRRKMIVKAKDTFVEALLLSMAYVGGNLAPVKYFQEYKTLQAISQEYANGPTVIDPSNPVKGSQIPIIQLIDVTALDRIFSVKTTTPVEKVKDFFEESLSKSLNIDLNLAVFESKLENVKFREFIMLSNQNGDQDSAQITLLLIENRGKKSIYFFEPTYSIVGLPVLIQ